MIKVLRKANKEDLKDFLYSINTEDNNLYTILEKEPVGVFQFSGGTAKNVTRQVKPENFEDMVAINAFARPGTIDFLPQYLDNKRNNTAFYADKINDILKSTHGTVIFQEQAMSVFNKIGGFTLEETNNCIFENELISTNIGEKTIREIVEDKMDVEILTLNEDTFDLEFKKIENYFDNGCKEVLEIELEDGRIIKCTKDHKIFTENRGWVEAQFLTENDEVFSL